MRGCPIYDEYQPTGGYFRMKETCEECKGRGYFEGERYVTKKKKNKT